MWEDWSFSFELHEGLILWKHIADNVLNAFILIVFVQAVIIKNNNGMSLILQSLITIHYCSITKCIWTWKGTKWLYEQNLKQVTNVYTKTPIFEDWCHRQGTKYFSWTNTQALIEPREHALHQSFVDILGDNGLNQYVWGIRWTPALPTKPN